MRSKMIRLFLLLAAMSLVVACAGGGSKAPEWVSKGSGAFNTKGGKIFYGVGSASGINNLSLLRSTADNRARNEIAKQVEFYSASLMKDFMSSTMAGDPNVSSEQQQVEQAIKSVTAQTLRGVQIVERWKDPESGEFFSLAQLDLDAYKMTVESAKELNSTVREYIKANADRLHSELDREIEKRQ